MTRLGLPQSDDTLLRALKRRLVDRQDVEPVRVVGVDDWSWRKGSSYGTIMADLEQREVLDVLADRSAETTARWLAGHPEVEIISRDRCGLYAQGAVQGAPQARQVADRFHLLQNLRQSIERQLSRSPRPPQPIAPCEASLAPPETVIRRYGPGNLRSPRIGISFKRGVAPPCTVGSIRSKLSSAKVKAMARLLARLAYIGEP